MTIDTTTGYNRHDYRVYSEIYPDDEIYWTWDYGYTDGSWPYPKETRFNGDATLFSARPFDDQNTWPLQILETNGDPATTKPYIWNVWRGYIYYRKDTKRNISGSYDWRNAWIRRYNSAGVYHAWSAEIGYERGDVVVCDDTWIYVAMDSSTGIDPLAYDIFNLPPSGIGLDKFDNISGLYTYPGSLGDELTPYVPTSPRRSWLRLWPATYNWFSPWANTPRDFNPDMEKEKSFFVGNIDSHYGSGYDLQPIIFVLTVNTYNDVYAFSGDGDIISGGVDETNLKYIRNVNLGEASYIMTTYNAENISGNEWTPPLGDTQSGPKLEETTIYPSTSYSGKSSIGGSPYAGFSFVNDNRIVINANGIFDLSSEKGFDSVGGMINGLDFGKNSAGNTFYVLPSSPAIREEIFNQIYTDIYGEIEPGIGYSNNSYGGAFILNSITGTDPTTADVRYAPNTFDVRTEEDRIEINSTERERYLMSGFGDNHFGDNFTGNVAFCVLQYKIHDLRPGSPEISSLFIDDVNITYNVDGVFSGNRFKSRNRGNLFLHGMSEVSIDSSDSSIFETVSKSSISISQSDVLRNIDSSTLDNICYNSFSSLQAVFHKGSARHNYAENLYDSTINDSFWYNTISFYHNALNWGTGEYRISAGNYFGQSFQKNRLRGYLISNKFGDHFVNNGCIDNYDIVSNLLGNDFGARQYSNYISTMINTTVEPAAMQKLDLGNNVILRIQYFNKRILRNAQWRLETNAWSDYATFLNFYDSTSTLQWQEYNNGVNFNVSGGPYLNF